MAARDTSNLINFSADEILEHEKSEISFAVSEDQLINASRCSFDNPFDKALAQVAFMSDPFESVFQEAEGFSNIFHQEVKTDQLLSISGDDRTLSGENQSKQDSLVAPTFNRMMSIPSTGSVLSSISSINSPQCSLSHLDSIFDLTMNSTDKTSKFNVAFVEGAIENETNLESVESVNESSSILNKAFVNNTGSEHLHKSNDSRQGASSLKEVFTQNSSNSLKRFKAKKEPPNLLKLSLANNSSPRLSETDGSESVGESLRNEANRLAVELSNLENGRLAKDDSCCEDLMSIKPPNWTDSESDLDSDLELLKIPMLDRIQTEVSLPQIAVESAIEETCAESKNNTSIKISKSVDLVALKERIEKEKLKSLSTDIGVIIDTLKKIILDSSNEGNKAEADNLLETLSTVLTDQTQEGPALVAPPQPIIRQGTFDLPVSKNKNHNTQVQETTPLEENDTYISRDVQKTLPEIVEQIGKLFGNENVNIVQTNFSGSSTGNNPTYIVVMGTPTIPSKKREHFFNEEWDGSPELTNSQMRRRSQSLSLADKSGLLKRDASARKTPLFIGSTRRNSFSSVLKGPGLQSVRRSIYGQISTNIDTIKNQKVLPSRTELNVPGKSFKQVNPELIKKKIRTKSNESVPPKTRGPLKATVSLKQMAPMIITPSVSSPIDKKQKFKPMTSTPIILTPKTKGFPNACSTPHLQVSPAKSAGKNRVRYSYMSATPNAKMRTTSQQRRRSLTELKSPRKGLETVKEIGVAKAHVRTIKVPQNFVRKTSLLQKCESIVDNKENKIPRATK